MRQNDRIIEMLRTMMAPPTVSIPLSELIQPPDAQETNHMRELLRILRGEDDSYGRPEGLTAEQIRDATEQVAAPDPSETCIICTDSLGQGNEAVRLRACGHTFHGVGCLNSWLVTSQQCPTCRAQVLEINQSFSQ